VPPQGHNTPFPLERSPPGSFKRLLGRSPMRREVSLGRRTVEEPVEEANHAAAPAAAGLCALGAEMLDPLFGVRSDGDSHRGFAVATTLTKDRTVHGLEAVGLTARG